MAGKTAILAVRIITDATDAEKGFDKASKSAGGFSNAIDKATPAANFFTSSA